MPRSAGSAAVQEKSQRRWSKLLCAGEQVVSKAMSGIKLFYRDWMLEDSSCCFAGGHDLTSET